ncbi:MAG: SMC-Scp complex subunit ScpB [Proteobacteria bacterium]|nr:SMC-Scp complex subunit ScpB [Pseudomonadota bacterium]
METPELKQVVESLLFITDSPLPMARLRQVLGVKDEEKIRAIIDEIRGDYESRGSAVQILEIAEGFQMASRPPQASFIRKLYAERMTMRLSSAALETLSIIAYKQPLTRAEIEEIRGVEVIAALETLLDKRLVKVVGRKESVGRPLLYGTSPEFLRHFGLKSIDALPPIDSFTPPEPGAPPAAVAAATAESAPSDAPAADAAAQGESEAAGAAVAVEEKPAAESDAAEGSSEN